MSSGPPTDDAALAAFLSRVETKLDAALTRGDDHEARLRALDDELHALRGEVAETASEAAKRVTPRDLWLGLVGAVGVAASLSAIVSNFLP